MESIADTVIRTVVENQFASFEAAQDRVTPEATLIEDLGVDSLDRVEIAVALEEELDLDLSDETAEAWVTVGDIIRSAGGE